MSYESVNSSVNIPKRTYDGEEWYETVKNQDYLTPEVIEQWAEADFYFYLVVSILTIAFMVGIILLYCFCCVWVMKGNLDLPKNGVIPSTTDYFLKYPIPHFMRKLLRYNIENSAIESNNSNARSQESSASNRATTSQPDVAMPSSSTSGISTISRRRSSDQPSNSQSGQTSNILEAKTKNLCNSFKQFQQFRYDIQDDEPEDVVFDLYDLQK